MGSRLALHVPAALIIMTALLLGGISPARVLTARDKETTLKIAAYNNLTRSYDPVEITGVYFPSFWGKKTSNLRLMVLRQGKWQMIPFQIDQRTPDEKFLLPQGPEANLRSGDDLFDRQDLLCFMARDLGDQANPESLKGAWEEIIELTVSDPLAHGRGWGYLARYLSEPPAREFAPLAVFSPGPPISCRGASYEIRGMSVKVLGKKHFLPVPDYWAVPRESGGSGENLLERMRLRAKLSFLFGMLNLELNERDLSGGVTAYSSGPIRYLARLWMSVSLPLNLRGPRFYVDVYGYDTFISAPVRIHFPFNPGYVLTYLRLENGLSLSERALGMKFYNSRNPEGYKIDGVPEERELKMDTGLDSWRLISGTQGAMLTRSDWDQDYRRQAEVAVYFEDNLKHRRRGESSSGLLGYHYNVSTVKNLKSRTYDLEFDWFFPPYFFDPERVRMDKIKAYMDIKSTPLKIRAEKEEWDNRAGRPLPLEMN